MPEIELPEYPTLVLAIQKFPSCVCYLISYFLCRKKPFILVLPLLHHSCQCPCPNGS